MKLTNHYRAIAHDNIDTAPRHGRVVRLSQKSHLDWFWLAASRLGMVGRAARLMPQLLQNGFIYVVVREDLTRRCAGLERSTDDVKLFLNAPAAPLPTRDDLNDAAHPPIHAAP